MTLKELSDQYKAAAQPLRERLSELRRKMAATRDPDAIWHYKRRIAELTPMLTQMNDLAWMLEHYYEIGGGDADTRYGFNGKRKIRHPEAKQNTDADPRRGTQRIATQNLLGVPYQEENGGADSRRTGGKQEYRLQNIEACGGQCFPHNEVFPDVSKFFSSAPEQWRKQCEEIKPGV